MLTALITLLLAAPFAFPPPAPPADPSSLGAGVQRTMTLLATSTEHRKNTVRILFYGQSITEQAWAKLVADDLRQRFPHADLQIENRAIGGFASQLLVQTAEHDLYPFYPDLLIFHVYGSNKEYEQIIRNVRARTTAEVLMQSDHVTRWPPADPESQADKGLWWDNLMNTRLLPEIARKHGATLLDVRNPWLAYLKSNNLQPSALLKDNVHLNDHGNFLLAELVKRHLVHRPDLPDESWKDLVRIYEVGKDIQWKDGKLLLSFEGNRVDLIPAASPSGAAIDIRIDGKLPSAFPQAYRVTRPTPGPWSPLFLKRVNLSPQALPVAQDWTLVVTEVSADSKSYMFSATGSKTGPDGSGESGKSFASTSGQFTLAADAFFPAGKLTPGYRIRFSVVPTHLDAYTPPKTLDPATDNAATIVQGIPNARHTLELSCADPRSLKAIRVYRPPGK